MTRPLQTIVIATSLTDASDGVVRTGAALARATGATPWLVHAYPPFLPGFFGDETDTDPRWVQEQVKLLRERVFEQARRTGLSAVAGFSPDRVALRIGSPHREIVDLAHCVHADLVVVGAAEAPHGILGSTAERVIRKASCAVFTVREEAAFPPARVELAVDLSPSSAHAMRWGLGLLAQLGPPLPDMEALFVLNPFEVGGSVHFTPEQVERFASEELLRFVAANAPEGLRPQSTRVRNGYARPEILAAIAERRVDLTVLGTHGLSGFERLVIGSIAAGVMRSAGCNLLIVPPAASRLHDAAVERGEELGGRHSASDGQASPLASSAAALAASTTHSRLWGRSRTSERSRTR